MKGAARKRRNPYGSEWGADGEVAFEYETAVRDALMNATLGTDEPGVIRFRELLEASPEIVRSSYSPAGRRTLLAVRGSSDIRTPPDPLRVLMIPAQYLTLTGPRNGTAGIFAYALEDLNRHWPAPGHEWFVDLLSPIDEWPVFEFVLAPVRSKNPAGKPKSFRPPKVVVQVQLQKETRPGFETGRLIAQPSDIVKALDEYMGGRATEVYIALFVNVRNQLVGYTEMSSGSVASVEVDASGLFRDALASGAAGVFTAHNHPSGDPTPSDDDRRLWARLRDVGKLIGIPVVDNMVIGRGGRFFSEMQESP